MIESHQGPTDFLTFESLYFLFFKSCFFNADFLVKKGF